MLKKQVENIGGAQIVVRQVKDKWFAMSICF